VPSPDTTLPAVEAAVGRLATALETRIPCAPVRDLIGTDDLAAAYAVQQGLRPATSSCPARWGRSCRSGRGTWSRRRSAGSRRSSQSSRS